MSAPKWTEGPWLKVTTGNVGNLIETPDGRIVGHFQAPGWGLDRDEIAQANGDLMAAAPELYEAVKRLLNPPPLAGPPGAIDRAEDQIKADYAFAKAALSKAEGRQP